MPEISGILGFYIRSGFHILAGLLLLRRLSALMQGAFSHLIIFARSK